MMRDELLERATRFGDRVLDLIDNLPESRSGRIVANQLGRSGSAIAANYRAARRGRSTKEFRSKLCTVVEEADETVHWLGVIERRRMMKPTRIADLQCEAIELLKIFSRMRKTAFTGK